MINSNIYWFYCWIIKTDIDWFSAEWIKCLNQFISIELDQIELTLKWNHFPPVFGLKKRKKKEKKKKKKFREAAEAASFPFTNSIVTDTHRHTHTLTHTHQTNQPSNTHTHSRTSIEYLWINRKTRAAPLFDVKSHLQQLI